VDRDIEDATILANNSVEKTYSFITQTIDFPGAQSTVAQSINGNINSALAQYIGEIVGYYFDGAHWHGFLIANGAYLNIDCASASDTFAYGANDPTFQNAGLSSVITTFSSTIPSNPTAFCMMSPMAAARISTIQGQWRLARLA